MSNVWEVVKIINSKRKTLTDDEIVKLYNPMIINKVYSAYEDTLYLAASLNRNPNMDKIAQFNYLMNGVRSGYRPRKAWMKVEFEKDVKVISEYNQITLEKAQELCVRGIFSDDDLNRMARQLKDWEKIRKENEKV